jgi:hypothetical protein
METLSRGMLNLRLSQFFADDRTPKTEDDATRLQGGLDFISRSLAGVRYLEAGETEGLEEDSLKHARYARRSVRDTLRSAGNNDRDFRNYLESLANDLRKCVDNPSAPLALAERQRLEQFFAAVGEAMITEVMDTDPSPNDWPTRTHESECLL